jgi:chromosome segregation ATPase
VFLRFERVFTVATIDIIGLIRGRKEQRAAGIEDLAHRLAGGEAVAPEEIEAVLDRTGCDEETLQGRIDSLVRRAELIAAVKAGEQAQAKAGKIEAEIGKAFEKVVAADKVHRDLRAKHADELRALGHVVDQGNRARDSLLEPALLAPADRARLDQARQAASAAAVALGDLRRRLPDLRRDLEEGERLLEDATDEAKRFRNNADLQDRKARAENAVKARRGRLADAERELPGLQAAADKAEAAVVALEAELRR